MGRARPPLASAPKLLLLCAVLWVAASYVRHHPWQQGQSGLVLGVRRARKGPPFAAAAPAVLWPAQAGLPHDEDVVVGVVSVARPDRSYLANTLRSLQCSLDSDGSRPRVLILNGQVPAEQHTACRGVVSELRRALLNSSSSASRFQFVELRTQHSCLAAAAAAPGGLPRRHNHSAARTFWRSKEVLDAAYLMEAALRASPRAELFVFLQDDIRVAPGWLGALRDYASGGGRQADFISLFSHGDGAMFSGDTAGPNDFSQSYANSAGNQVGLVGLAFRIRAPGPQGGSSDGRERCTLVHLIEHLRAHWLEDPVDWLLDSFMQANKCVMHVLLPNLVDHVGRMSSLKGKVQRIVSTTFHAQGARACDFPEPEDEARTNLVETEDAYA